MGTYRNFAGAMLQFLIITGCFQSSYSLACAKINDCSCKKSNGHIMDLGPIAGGKSGPKFTGEEPSKPENYKFLWNPCTPFSLSPPGACQDVLLCQENSKFQYPVAKKVDSFDEGTDSITISYGSVTKDGYARQGVITLKCDPSKYPGEFIGQFKEDDEKDKVIKYRISTNQTATLNLMKKGIKRKPSAVDLNLTTNKITQYSLLQHLFYALLLMVVSRFHIYYRALSLMFLWILPCLYSLDGTIIPHSPIIDIMLCRSFFTKCSLVKAAFHVVG